MDIEFTFPFHKYLGPGNKLDKGKPVDYADLLAAIHDIKYLNNNREHIQAVDYHFARDFFNVFWQEYSVCSLIGGLGLYGKYWLERLSEHQFYPEPPDTAHIQQPMDQPGSSKHKVRELYSKRQKDISKAYKEHKAKGGTSNWNLFVRNWHSTSEKPHEGAVTKPSASKEGYKGVLPRSSTTTEESAIETPEESLDLNLPMEFVDMEAMDIGGHSGGAQATPIGSTSQVTKKLAIPRSLKLNSYTLTFNKSPIFYTYGYAFQNITKPRTRTNQTTKVTTDS